ncbi:MAG: DDE-type integrase/transposase/recombinase [Candidatus Odinarchaeota archaeon]
MAGVQTVGHLEKLYLIALLDDNSRFIVAAEYFKNQKGINVIKVIRNFVLAYGRPNQIFTDNGTQFRNLIGELGIKYTKLLEILDNKPIFAKLNHPQTKGKLERWFGTVK